MKNKGIILIVVFAVLAGMAALVLPKPDTGSRGGVQQGDPVLIFDGAAIQSIEVKSPALNVSVTKTDQGWLFPDVANFPANVESLRDVVRDLSELKIGNTVIGGETMLDEFGLGTAARTVELKDASGKVLASLLVGDAREGAGAQSPMNFQQSNGTYVRAGDGPVVIADGSLYSLPSRPTAWMDTSLSSIQAADIDRITVQVDQDKPYDLIVKDGSTFELSGMATNLTLDTTKAGGLARAFQYLSFDGVEGTAVPTNVTAKVDVICKDGVTLNIDLSELDGSTLYRHKATFTPPPAPTKEQVAKDVAADAEEREAKIDAALAATLAGHNDSVDAAQTKVEGLNAKAAWTYRLSSYSADNLRTRRADLEKEPESEEAAPAAPGLAP